MSGPVLHVSKFQDQEFLIDISRGKYPKYQNVHKFGANLIIDAVGEDIWTYGGNLNYLTSAETLQVSSSSALDTLLGTGARRVRIFGLDANFNQITEDVDLNGTTPVNTVNQYIRVYRMYVTENGTYGGFNIGEIILETAGANVQAQISNSELIAFGQTEMTHYTVPANHKAYLLGFEINIETSKAVEIALLIRNRADDTTTPAPWRTIKYLGQLQTHIPTSRVTPIIIDEKTDIRFFAKTAQGTASVEVTYHLVLENLDIV